MIDRIDTIKRPEGLVELEPRFLEYYSFLLEWRNNHPRGYSGTPDLTFAIRLWEQRPKALAFGDTVLWMERLKPFGPYTIHEMTRSQFERKYQ